MKTNHKFTFEIMPQDTDFTRKINITALGNYILANAARMAATQNNFGIEALMKENLTWVVTRFAIEMQYYPAHNEQINIETWVEDYGKLFTTRNFKIFDKDDNQIGAATSVWAVIDLTTRRPYNLDNKIEWHRAATGIGAGIEKPIKLDEIPPEIPATVYHSVAYSDIDINQHTNSMKYVEWFLNTLDIEKFKHKNIVRFDVNYMHEALFGEKVAIFTEEKDNKNFCEIRNLNNKSLCRIRLMWR